ncbi:MAG: cell division protein ZapA [candidate division Zixibacteria bacterium]|nr:cell division protein ZapA [candidate division Zixibacteria bacterium]
MLDMSEQQSKHAIENTVVVKICGEEYPITGYSDPAYISKVAEYVDEKMRLVALNSRNKARDKVAILTALSIASELLENSDRLSESRQGVDSRLGVLLNRLDAALTDGPSTQS